MESDSVWGQSAQQFQQMFGDSWQRAVQALQAPNTGALTASGAPALPAVKFAPEKLQQLQKEYMDQARALWAQGLPSASTAPALFGKDKRFSAEAWAQNPAAALTAATYLLNAKALMGLAEAVEGDEKTRSRVRFGVEQWVAAMSPSNFLASNAEALRMAVETRGESIAKGMQNLMADMRQGHVSMTDESLFEVGSNVATTEGAVVYERPSLRTAISAGAAVHQQVLYPGPAAREFLHSLCGQPGTAHLCGELAQSRRQHEQKDLGQLRRRRRD